MLKDSEKHPERSLAPNQSRLFVGFNLLRAAAITLVYLQHQLTVLNLERYTNIYGLTMGQVGVSIFLVLSGVLAARSHQTPEKWLCRRLSRIYPAYIIVIAFGFLLTYIFNYKTFGFDQVISQLLGIGLLTHSENLVNTPTWFVTLILILYVFTFLTKRLQIDFQFAVLSSGLLLIPVVLGYEKILPLYSQSIAYSASYFLFSEKEPAKWRVIICALVLLLCSYNFRTLAYPAIGIALLLCVSKVKHVPKVVSFISDISYEFYLCHGIFLVGGQRLSPTMPVIGALAGLVASIVVAVILQRVTKSISQKMRLPRGCTQQADVDRSDT